LLAVGREALLARARFNAPLTESSLLSSMSATSAVWKPSTSRSTSAARWRGGSCWSAAMNASSIVSLVS
jgi:hypothetical protein